jgi:hypothetical protein
LCTGVSSRALTPALVVLALLFAASTSHAQGLKLVSLLVPPDVHSGSWISYQVNVVFKNRPPKRVMQRLAVVSREGIGDEAGAWIELKTVENGRARVERGFFAPPEHAPARSGATKLTLARYQRLMPDGRLFEYPVGEEGSPLADDDISAMDLIEFAGSTMTDTLAPDTVRVGAGVLPCAVERVRRYGKQDWQGSDSTFVNRAVMTRTDWWSQGVPVTGYARSIIEVSSERVPAGSQAQADSLSRASVDPVRIPYGTPPFALAPAAGQSPPAGAAPGATGGQGFFFRADIILLGMGNDAVPEITQAPEPAPEGITPRQKIIIK